MPQAWNSLISFPKRLWQHATSTHQKLRTQLNSMRTNVDKSTVQQFKIHIHKTRTLGSILSNSQLFAGTLSLSMPRHSRVAVDICKYLLLLHLLQKPQAILPGRWMGCGSSAKGFLRKVKSWMTMNYTMRHISYETIIYHLYIYIHLYILLGIMRFCDVLIKYVIFLVSKWHSPLAYRTLGFHKPCANQHNQNLAWIECQINTSVWKHRKRMKTSTKMQLEDTTHLRCYKRWWQSSMPPWPLLWGDVVPEPNHILIGAKHLQNMLIWELYTLHNVATFPLVNLCKAMLLSKCPSPRLPWCFANWQLRFPSSLNSIPY